MRRLRLTPVMFELGARPHPPRELYRAYLAQSDVFVGIYWRRYGWVAPGEPVSGLEDEYLLSGDRPKLIYVKAADDREPRLDALLDRVRADDRAAYKPFERAEELTDLVADDLAVLLTERFARPAGMPAGRRRDCGPRTCRCRRPGSSAGNRGRPRSPTCWPTERAAGHRRRPGRDRQDQAGARGRRARQSAAGALRRGLVRRPRQQYATEPVKAT